MIKWCRFIDQSTINGKTTKTKVFRTFRMMGSGHLPSCQNRTCSNNYSGNKENKKLKINIFVQKQKPIHEMKWRNR